eukprot:Hpha_TRINITY_DN15916_c5_g1::TRINITY_DN15916_c5_g1_i1::g.72770::m.72770
MVSPLRYRITPTHKRRTRKRRRSVTSPVRRRWSWIAELAKAMQRCTIFRTTRELHSLYRSRGAFPVAEAFVSVSGRSLQSPSDHPDLLFASPFVTVLCKRVPQTGILSKRQGYTLHQATRQQNKKLFLKSSFIGMHHTSYSYSTILPCAQLLKGFTTFGSSLLRRGAHLAWLSVASTTYVGSPLCNRPHWSPSSPVSIQPAYHPRKRNLFILRWGLGRLKLGGPQGRTPPPIHSEEGETRGRVQAWSMPRTRNWALFAYDLLFSFFHLLAFRTPQQDFYSGGFVVRKWCPTPGNCSSPGGASDFPGTPWHTPFPFPTGGKGSLLSCRGLVSPPTLSFPNSPSGVSPRGR